MANEPQAEQVVKLATGTFGGVATIIYKNRVTEAVSVGEKGKLIFKWIESEAQEAAFYADFLNRVIAYPENLAKANATYLKNQIAANPQAYTLAEIAFLCKILVLPSFTFPITMSFSDWENVARVNPANLPVVFEQLWNANPTGTGTTTGTGTAPTGTNTPTTSTPTGTTTENKSGISSFFLSVLGGVSVYLITRSIPKMK